MARRGLFGRIADAVKSIGDALTGTPRRAAPRPEPPRQAPEPPRRRERRADTPEARVWRQNTGKRPGTRAYQHHREVMTSIPYFSDMDEDEQIDFWDSYTRYMVDVKDAPYRINSLDNPFWSEVGIHPDDFDWHEWREAMGYPHGARR